MAVLTVNRDRPHRNVTKAPRTVPLAGYTNFASGSTAHTVYKGSVVVSDVSDTDGYARACPLCSTTNMASGDVFEGIAVERVDVTSSDTADGAKTASVYIDGEWAFPVGALAITDQGAAIYATDDDNVSSTSSNNLWIGQLVDVDATYAWVDISRAAGMPNSAT